MVEAEKTTDQVKIMASHAEGIDAEELVRQAGAALLSQFSGQELDYCLVLYNLPNSQKDRLMACVKNQLKPKSFSAIQSPCLIYNYKFFSKGIIIVAYSGMEVRTNGFFDAVNIREQTEKYIWRMSQDVYQPRKLFMSFSSLVDECFSEHIKGIEISVGKKSPILGTFNCGDERDLRYSLAWDGNHGRQGSVASLFYTPIKAVIKSGSGFKPLGRSGVVKCREHSKHIIETIDGEPAIEFYKRFLGDKLGHDEAYAKRVFDRYPLGHRLNEFNYHILRPHKIMEDGSLMFLRDFPGDTVRLMIPTRDGLLTEIRSAALRVKQTMPEKQLVLFFDSSLRYKFFGLHYDRQLKALKDTLGNIDCVGAVFRGTISMFDSDMPEFGHTVSEHHFAMVPLGGQ